MSYAPAEPIVFVDLETTGATGAHDRITEIGIVEVTPKGEMTEWSSLVNPQTPIPAFIQGLTGISDAMVATAPTFEELAEEVWSRLQGRLFVAHNAKFDHGFLKSEFKRVGRDFKSSVLCTVKLSKLLFPQHAKHNLDALIERHSLYMPARHRALADASVLWQFWQVLRDQIPAEQLTEAVGQLTGRGVWPSHLDPAVLDDLPESHGVYLMYGEEGAPLFIGKSPNLRQGVLSHFQRPAKSSKVPHWPSLVRRIEWRETEGELGASLKEVQLIQHWQPVHNRKAASHRDLCTWRLLPQSSGEDAMLRPDLIAAHDVDWRQASAVYGLFGSRRDAVKTLREIAESAQLCVVTLGLEQASSGRPCSAYDNQACSGVCIGQEPKAAHSARLQAVLSDWQVKPWPFPVPVMVREGRAWHVLDAWSYLGSAHTQEEVSEVLRQARPVFDKDTYRILVSCLRKLATVTGAEDGVVYAVPT